MGKAHSVLYGLPVKRIASICHVDLSTARRWKRGAICPPFSSLALLQGDLGAFGEYWRGWRVRGEEIVSPDGWCIRRDDALSVPLLIGQIGALQQELSKLKGDDIEEQPLPSDVPAISA